MQKKWMIAGASVLVVAGAMPWIVGFVTEQQWQQATQEVNRSQPFVRMETGDYRRGVLGSELTGSLVVQNPDTGESHHFDYRARVSHGVTGSLLDFQPVGGWSPEGTDWFPESQPRLTLETRLWGTATVELEAPTMTMTNDTTGESLSTSGGLARVEISDAGSRAEALMVWPALSLSGPEVDIRIADIHLEQNMEHLVGDVWTGAGELDVGSMVVTPEADEPVNFRDFSMTTTTEANPDRTRIDSTVTIELEEIVRADRGYGPHRVEFALEGLDVASWSSLTEGMSDLQSMVVQAGPSGGPEPERQLAAMEQVNKALRDLAAAGFSVGFPALSLSTPEGAVTGHAMIRHPELSAEDKAGMLMVMQRLTGEMNLSVPSALAEKYPEVRLQLAPLVKQGLLIQDGDQLVMQGVMKDLMVDVNGMEIPLPPLL
ncbi:DUF945 family protein [Marinobacter sp. F4206]|uniref:DUF945 family protein n=1 Tax=Marinobacter sp. F4206 TaxID=2861777 RepID=UPI001C5FE18C|nr:DUF945 family protein [Marinobacter sp. F4206]MBW4934678.1 YdgA family protein [Marinobacter sp. F4206]